MMKSCARTVLRPFSPARFAAWAISQPTYALRPSSASPAVLQPASLIIPRTFDETSSISVGLPPPPPPDLPFFALAIFFFSCFEARFFYTETQSREAPNAVFSAQNANWGKFARSDFLSLQLDDER